MSSKALTPAERRFLDIHISKQRGGLDGDEPLPPPPYQVGDVEMLFTGVRFAPGAARALLPPELEPAGNDSGLICAYTVATGWSIAPFTAFYAAVEVKGYDAPDGSSGYCIVHGWYSGGGYRFMNRYYNQFAQPGHSQLARDGDVLTASAGPPGVDVVTVQARRAPMGPPEAQVIHHYLGQHPAGGASLFGIAFSGLADNAEPLGIDISDRAGERMQLARPAALIYSLHCYDANLTFGIPQRVATGLDLPGAGAQVTVLDAFARIGRAAVIVAEDGAIGAMTPRAGALIGDGLVTVRGHLRASDPALQIALERLIVDAAGPHSQGLAPIAVRRTSGPPLIVDALSIGSVATGRPAVLLLITDADQPIAGSAGAALQLLGLTPAEARIADLVGAGRSPREVADALDLSLNTVRSALKIAFDKLGISRQAELAKIVARLAG